MHAQNAMLEQKAERNMSDESKISSLETFSHRAMDADHQAMYARLDALVNKFRTKIMQDAEDALTHMDGAQLTNDQKFALAVLADVPYYYDDEARLWRTVKCSVAMAGLSVAICWIPEGQTEYKSVFWTKKY